MVFAIRPWQAVLSAILATGLVAALRVALNPVLGNELPLLPFALSTLIAAWIGGLRVGLFATALGWIAGDYLFLEPRASLGTFTRLDQLRFAIFVVGNGTLSWLVSALQDAQRRAAAERARLEKSEAFHAAIAELSADFAFEVRVDPDGRFDLEALSGGFAKQFGYTLEELRALGVRDLVHPDDAAQAESQRARLEAGETTSGELRGFTRDGREVWLEFRNRPLRDPAGRVARIYGAARDITREKQAEAARATAAADAHARAQALAENKERLEHALSVGRMVAWDYDLTTGEVVRSENARDLMGVGSGPIEDFYEVVHPEDRAALRGLLERAAKGDVEYEREFRVLGADGATLWFSDRARLRREADGRPTHLIGICVDVTDRKRAEQALGEREEQLRLALDAAAMIGFDWDIRSGRVTRLGNVPEDSLLGGEYGFDDVVERIHPDDRTGWEASLRAALEGDATVFRSEHRSRTDDGAYQWILVHARIDRGSDGAPLRMLGVGIDVTPLREMHEALREADRRKDEFLATLAHELRNPLAPLRNGLQVLRMDAGLKPATLRVHEMMERQVDQMVRLVDDLLEVSRITRGQIELRRQPVAIRTLIDNAVETSRPLIEAGRHQIAIDVPDAPLCVNADPIRLAQVLSNLLNNAARYTPPGGRIAIDARQEGREVAVTVRDTGVGISPESLPRVFDMFVRGDDLHAGGLGIGLALVRALVEMHGGRVDAQSPGLGLGSEFVVRLPLAAIEAASEASPAAAAPASDIQRLRIVAVDDNRDAADTLSMLLARLGAEVTVAYDAESALEAIRSQRPRLALVDLGMPVIDGFELARRVRAEPRMDAVMLVALSGWGQEQDRRRSRAAGFDDHLVKPVDVDALRRLLASLS